LWAVRNARILSAIGTASSSLAPGNGQRSGGRRTKEELLATAARRLLIVAPPSVAYPDFTSPGRGQARFDQAGGAGTQHVIKFSGRPARESSPFRATG
jgi:hypothetical protein